MKIIEKVNDQVVLIRCKQGHEFQRLTSTEVVICGRCRTVGWMDKMLRRYEEERTKNYQK